jgi:hypothetical protein
MSILHLLINCAFLLSQKQPCKSMKAVASPMSAVATSSSDESPIVLAFLDRLTGRRVSVVIVAADGQLQSPNRLRTHIMRPLELMQATVWFFELQAYFSCGKLIPLPFLQSKHSTALLCMA